MSSKLEKKYPPYSGSEPFVFLCFEDSDSDKVEPLLSSLYSRGCRIWYSMGGSANITQEKAVQSRMKEAGLVIAYCTSAFHNSSAKSRMMFLQSLNIPVITVDEEKTDNLSAGLREGTPHIEAYNGISDDTVASLISTDGFSYAFLGERPAPVNNDAKSRWVRILGIILAGLLIVATAFVILVKSGVIVPKQTDNAAVEKITLNTLPSDISELETKYPALKTIVIPKSEAQSNDIEQYMDKYAVVITEG